MTTIPPHDADPFDVVLAQLAKLGDALDELRRTHDAEMELWCQELAKLRFDLAIAAGMAEDVEPEPVALQCTSHMHGNWRGIPPRCQLPNGHGGMHEDSAGRWTDDGQDELR